MGKIPWTQNDSLNKAILAGYLRLVDLQAELARVGSAWADLPEPRVAPTPIYKTRGAKSPGPNPHLLGRMLKRGQNMRRRATWRSQAGAGLAAAWAARKLAPLVGQ